MLKKLGAILLAIVVGSGCAQPTVVPPPQRPVSVNMVTQVQAMSVALVAWVLRGPDGVDHIIPDDLPGSRMIPFCTGVWVHDRTFVTANHCAQELGHSLLETIAAQAEGRAVGGARTGWYVGFNDVTGAPLRTPKTARPCHVLDVDEVNDLSLIRIDDEPPQHPSATVAQGVQVGDDLHLLGQTMGMWWSYSRGTVSQLRFGLSNPSGGNSGSTIQVIGAVWSGSSGGGAFNLAGELVGITSWTIRGTPISFFVDGRHVRDLMRANALTR